MSARNTTERYGWLARSFHWIMAVLILGMLAVGYAMQHVLAREDALPLYGIHKSVGICILLLLVLRWSWRMMNAVPPLPTHLSVALRALARGTHWVLYLLMAATPMLGILMSQSGGRDASVFGLYTLPRLVGENHEIHELLESAHAWSAYTMLGFISLHIAAALLHRFHYRDEVFGRMWPGAGIDVRTASSGTRS